MDDYTHNNVYKHQNTDNPVTKKSYYTIYAIGLTPELSK